MVMHRQGPEGWACASTQGSRGLRALQGLRAWWAGAIPEGPLEEGTFARGSIGLG